MTRIINLVVGLLALASAASAQSNIRNATLESRPGADLAATFQTPVERGGSPMWIGYAVPAQDPDWNACCYDSDRGGDRCCGRCLLDEGRSGGETRGGNVARGPVQLEAGARPSCCIASRTGRSSAFAPTPESCELDAGGLTVYWLTGVSTAASIDLLLQRASRPLPDGDRRDRVGDGAMHAIAGASRRSRRPGAGDADGGGQADGHPQAGGVLGRQRPGADRVRAGAQGAARHVQRRDVAEAPDVRRVAEPRARGRGHADQRREERCQSGRARRSDLLARAEGRPEGGERDHRRHRATIPKPRSRNARCSPSVSCRRTKACRS